MYNCKKYDWEVRDDAETLRRYQEIKSNPERMKKAKECIMDSVITGKAVLGNKPLNAPATKNSNKATIGRLNINIK